MSSAVRSSPIHSGRVKLTVAAANFPFGAVRPRIRSPAVKRTGPAVVKTKQTALVELRGRPLVRCTDYRWRELFENADVVSEGAIRAESGGPTYYGFTSILLKDQTHGGSFDDGERLILLQMLSVDPHARIRAVRIACLDAQLRAQTPLASIHAEFAAQLEPRGLRIAVEVEAAVKSDTGQCFASSGAKHRGQR